MCLGTSLNSMFWFHKWSTCKGYSRPKSNSKNNFTGQVRAQKVHHVPVWKWKAKKQSKNPKSTEVHSRCCIIISILQGSLLLNTKLQNIIPDSTCMTLMWVVLYNSKSSLLSGAVKEKHVNDRWLVIHHCHHLDTQEEITAQPRCVTSCV